MSIFFIRHGETSLNVVRTLQPADTPLSATGLAQAEALARRLAGMGVVHILSSDLPRALQTAQAIAAATGAAIETTPLLQERNFGDLRDRPYDGLGFDPLWMEAAPPGGESIAAFRARVAEAFALAVRLGGSLPGSLAVVTHGLVVRTVIEHHLVLAAGHVLPRQVRNTSLTIATVAAPHTTELVDCSGHLDGGPGHAEASLSGG